MCFVAFLILAGDGLIGGTGSVIYKCNFLRPAIAFKGFNL